MSTSCGLGPVERIDDPNAGGGKWFDIPCGDDKSVREGDCGDEIVSHTDGPAASASGGGKSRVTGTCLIIENQYSSGKLGQQSALEEVC